MRHHSNRPDRQYAAIPNAAMRDEHLSIGARGLLALLMTYADNWTFRRDHLMQVVGVGKDKFGRLMSELIEAGYVSHDYLHDERGRMTGRTWVINDQPGSTVVRKKPTTDNTVVRENRRPENPSSGESAPIRKPRHKKTNGKVTTNQPTDEFSEKWRPDSELTAWARAQGFTSEEIEAERLKWIDHWHAKGKRPVHPVGQSFKGWLLIELDYRAKRKGAAQVRNSSGAKWLARIARQDAAAARGSV